MMCCGFILFNLLTIRIVFTPFIYAGELEPLDGDARLCGLHPRPSFGKNIRTLSMRISIIDVPWRFLSWYLVSSDQWGGFRLTYVDLGFCYLICYFLCLLQDVERIQSILIKLGVEVNNVLFYMFLFIFIFFIFCFASVPSLNNCYSQFILFSCFISILQTFSHFSCICPFSLLPIGAWEHLQR